MGEGSLRPAYRVVLLSLLIAPIGGVLVQANVLRDLIMVIPATSADDHRIDSSAGVDCSIRNAPGNP